MRWVPPLTLLKPLEAADSPLSPLTPTKDFRRNSGADHRDWPAVLDGVWWRGVMSESRVRLFVGGFLLVLLVLAVYLPMLPGSFVMDDARLVGPAANPLVNGELTWRSVWFQTDFPVTLCAWWAEWSLWGDHALGYHAVNIALQMVSTVLLWRVLARLKIPGAWLGAAIFAVHPVAVSSVARIAELKNTLSLPFFLLSLAAYFEYEKSTLYPSAERRNGGDNHRGTAWFTLSFVSFIAALLSKTTTTGLPVVLLACAAWQRGRIARRDVVHTVPHFLVAFALGLMSVWFQKYQALAGEILVRQSFVERLAVAARNFWFYCGKALLPVNLTIFYPRWREDISIVAAFLPVVLLAGVFVVGWIFRRTWGRHLLLGVGCFAILLFPALGFFDAQCFTKFQVSDHLQYLPLVALLALVAGCVGSLRNRRVMAGVGVLLVGGLAVLGFQRARVFSSEETLLRDTLAKNPAAWAVHNDLGTLLARRGNVAEAATHFQMAAKLNPNDSSVLANLALTEAVQGRLTEASAEYQAALRLKPDSAALHEGLAPVLERLGNPAGAVAHLRIAARFDANADTRLNLARLLFQEHKFQQSVDELRTVLHREPENISGLNNLAYVLTSCPDQNIRNGGEAVRLAEHACQLTGFKRPQLINTLSAAYAEQGRSAEAADAAQLAARLTMATASAQPPGSDTTRD